MVLVFKLLNIDMLSIGSLAHDLREDLLALFVFVEFYEPLHEDAYREDLHKVICHKQVDDKVASTYYLTGRAHHHVEGPVPILKHGYVE